MDELPQGAKDFLALARAEDEPSAETRERVRRGVALAIAASGAAVATTAASHASASGTLASGAKLGWLTASATKIGLATGAVVVIGAAGLWMQPSANAPSAAGKPAQAQRPPSVQPVESAPPSPAPTHQDLAPQPLAPQPALVRDTPTPTAPAHRAHTQHTAPAPLPDASLGAEMALLHEASTAIDRGDLTQARTLLATHRTRFARGQLREERRGLEVLRACTLGGSAAARSARGYLASAPDSVLAARIANACKLGGAP